MVNDYLVRLSIRSAMFGGAITGFVFGLFAGATLGALVSWIAGAIVDWQAQLGFSLGIAQQLLPLGDQVKSLQSVSDRWFLVIPGVGLLIGLLGALIGLLAGGLWAAACNHAGRTANPVPVGVDNASCTNCNWVVNSTSLRPRAAKRLLRCSESTGRAT